MLLLILSVAFFWKAGNNVEGKTLWHPDGVSREDWLRCQGMPCDVFERTQRKLELVKSLFRNIFRNAADTADSLRSSDRNELCSVIWTEDDANQMLKFATENFYPNLTTSNQKILYDIADSFLEGRKWDSMPIFYKFDESHVHAEINSIRTALDRWMEQTCVRFQQIDKDDNTSDSHLIFVNSDEKSKCSSAVGKQPHSQQVVIGSDCFANLGTIIHEIGHALGLLHEHQRIGRDKYITVLFENIDPEAWSQFFPLRTLNFDTPYEYSSVMHYYSKAFSINDQITLKAVYPLYQSNMGQPHGISFFDAKAVNTAYCRDTCKSIIIPRPCRYGGYQDPNDCTKCKCPEGLSGTYCESIAPPINANCGGVMNVQDIVNISFPGFGSPRYYNGLIQCTWWLKVAQEYIMELQFKENFYVVNHGVVCLHWVEVKFKADIGAEGARFCGKYKAPINLPTIRSESNEMMVIFKYQSGHISFYTNFVNGTKFHAQIRRVKRDNPTTLSPVPGTATASPETDCGKIDLTFLIDSSGSVTLRTWNSILRTLSDFLQTTKIGPEDVRVAAISFSNEAVLHFNLNTYNNYEDIRVAMLKIGWKDQYTNLADALRLARVVYETGVARTDARHIIVILSDGIDTVNEESTRHEINLIKQMDIEAYAVAMGGKIDGNQLVSITGKESKVIYVYEMEDFDKNGANLSTSLRKKICGGESIFSSNPNFRWDCSFEGYSMCNITQSHEDQFDWTLNSGPTLSDTTGPDSAFDGDVYIYVEASNPRKINDTARIDLPLLPYTGSLCLSFAYHMTGDHINRLMLQKIVPPFYPLIVAWLRSGSHENKWFQASVTVEYKFFDTLAFVAVCGGDFAGDIALDNIRISSGRCE